MKKPRFKYYNPGIDEIPPEPTFSLWVPGGNGYSDVCGATLIQAGLPLPPFPDYKTWRDLVLAKKRCGRCWAAVKSADDLAHHNQTNHLGAPLYFPSAVRS